MKSALIVGLAANGFCTKMRIVASADSVMTVGTVKRAMIDQISAVENMTVFPDPDKVLVCSIDMNGLLQDNETLGNIGVKSGGQLMLL